MVLAQFIITSANNNTFQSIGISGKCSIRILAVQYHDSSGAGTSRIIQLQSDALYFPYSPAKYLTWINNGSSQVDLDNSRQEYHLQNVVLNGQVLLNVVDKATGTTPGNFTSCVVSLDIEKLNEEFH